MPNLKTIQEASQELGISTDTLRRWDKKGLIKSKRNELNYRVFDTEEIERIQSKLNGDTSKNHFKIYKNKKTYNYKVIELFAGAGGTALGFHNAGLQHALLIENDKFCVATLKKNKPKWNIDGRDIRTVDYTGIKADIVEGGFPCQAFSYAGKRQGFGETRGTLFFEFARAVDAIKPKIAVAENVRGLETHDEGRTLKTMLHTLENLGYKVAYKILKAQYFDVPQKRERIIIIGVRKNLNIPILFPKEKNYIVTLREALQNVPESEGQTYSKEKEKIMNLIPQGGYWKDLPEELQKSYMGASYYHTGGRTGMARRMSWDEPSLTLTTSPSQKQTERCHPEETRPFTVREYARIQTFPDDWVFEGGITSKYKQIGNAVPVNLGYHIANGIINMLEGNMDKDNFVIV